MKFLIGYALLIVAASAIAEETQLNIRVKVRAKGASTPAAFPGVGNFEIFRGSAKFDDGSCPDASDRNGRLVCTLKCAAGERAAKTLRVVPPGKSYKVRGYVAPAAAEVKLDKCKVQPNVEQVFVYVDPRIALAELVREQPPLMNIAKIDDRGESVTFYTTKEAIDAMQALGETPTGRQVLFRFQKYATAAAESPRVTLEKKDREATDAFPSVIGSIYLKQAVKQKIGYEAANKVKVDFEKSTYYGNLKAIEEELDAKTGRTGQQNFLLNNIQDWKGAPASATTEKLLGTLK